MPYVQLELYPATQSATDVFAQLTDLGELRRLFTAKVRLSKGRGIDRVDARTFQNRLEEHIRVVQRKLRDGSYRFSFYAEQLRLKGRGKEPRVISIPTFRDRLVLYVLKEILHYAFRDCVPRRLPNTRIRDLCVSLSALPDLVTYTCFRTDISDFYGSIDHRQLRDALGTRLDNELLTSVVMRAIKTPTVPIGARRNSVAAVRPRVGIPQGLSISNVLANIYAQPIDAALAVPQVVADRYVDDIVVIAPSSTYPLIERSFGQVVKDLGLSLNPSKTQTARADKAFDFLGYEIRWPTVTVKRSSVDRFLAAIAARLTAFRRGEALFRARHPWVTSRMYREVLVEDLNERITGATSGLKRYGWLFYFLEINDTALLDDMDAAIDRMVRRVPEFRTIGLPKLKSVKRAYYEARHNPRGHYIMQYDAIISHAEKRSFLERRGHVQSGVSLGVDEIDQLFDRVRRRRLATLEADVASMS